jgi:HK97 family phage major capsid protein/HK97 family phage prohead protease
MSNRLNAAETFKREASFDPSGLNADKRTCELSFSSELPVQRGDYMEVLSHEPGDCDLSRLNDAHPLLLNHDPERQIGVVESAAIRADKKGCATVRFSKSALGDEIWNDVKDGIRRLVSVGYRRTKELMSETRDGMEFVRFAWQPYEVSIVSVPADATVGIGRGAEKPIQEKVSNMSEVSVVNEPAKRDYQKTASEILAIAANLEGKVPNIREMANAAITSGKDVSEFRAQALDKLPEIQPVSAKSPLADVKARDWNNYSISRAIAMMLPGSKADGFEREISDEMSLKTGSRPTGLWIPDEAFVAKRNFVAGTNTLGGFLVQTDNAADQFVELLRNRAQVLNLGARVLNLSRPTTIPRQNAAGGVTIVAETTASTLSTGNFTQFTLTPQAASAYQQYSKQLLMENNPSIDALIRDDIMQQIALRIDLAALHGSGSGEPTGIIATTGIGTVLLSTNGLSLANTTAYPAMVSLETKVATANADVGALAYLMRPGQRGALKTQSRFASSDTPVWDIRTPGQPVNGYRAEVTAQIATNLTEGTATTICSTVFFGNWNDLIVAQFGATDIVSDPYTKAENGVVRILARRWFDIGVRHPASFAVLGGVLTT